MAHLLYLVIDTNNEKHLALKGNFHLAGIHKGLIHELWNDRGCPMKEGWHITKSDLIEKMNQRLHTQDDLRFIVDWFPKAPDWIAFKELEDIYVYSEDWETSSGGREHWTILMLVLKDVYVSLDGKTALDAKIHFPYSDLPVSEFDKTYEFLYLKGKQHGWVYGSSGMTNAAFIRGDARKFFSKYFCL